MTLEPKKKPDPYAVERSETAEAGEQGRSGTDAAHTGFSDRVQDGALIITFQQSNVLDAYEIEKLGDAIYHRIKPLDAPKVVVDLGHVEHLSSSALGMLIALRQVVVQKKAGALAIANVSKDLRSIFKMTKLDKQLVVSDSIDKAVRSLG